MELVGGARIRGYYLVAKDKESGQGLVGHGLAVLAVLRRERGERTQHGMLLQGIITFLWNIYTYLHDEKTVSVVSLETQAVVAKILTS